MICNIIQNRLHKSLQRKIPSAKNSKNDEFIIAFQHTLKYYTKFGYFWKDKEKKTDKKIIWNIPLWLKKRKPYEVGQVHCKICNHRINYPTNMEYGNPIRQFRHD